MESETESETDVLNQESYPSSSGGEIPMYAFEAEVWKILPRAHMFNDFKFKRVIDHNEGMNYNLAVSPILQWMFKAATVAVLAQIFAFILVKYTATCTSTGTATYPTWILGSMAPILIARLAIEYRCIKHYLPVYTYNAVESQTKPFKILVPMITLAGEPDPQNPYMWKPLCGPDVPKEAVYGALAEASGMATVQGLAIAKENPATENMVFVIQAKIDNIANRVIWSYVGENCIQINIQVSLFAMNTFLSSKKMTSGQVQALVSIGISIFMSLLKLQETLALENYFKNNLRAVAFMDGKMDPTISLDYGNDNSPWGYPTVRASVQRALWKVRVGSLVLMLSLGYAAAKLGGAFWCEDSMLNFSGCVDLKNLQH